MKYLGDRINIEIPQIYFTKQMLPAKVEIVLYTTKGDVIINMDDYVANAYVLTYGDGLTEPGDSIYSAPFDTWSAIRVSGIGVATGGSNAISFEAQRKRVVESAAQFRIPITPAQLVTKLEQDGYDVIQSIDNIMRRVYLGTRYLPANENSGFVNGAGCMMGMVQKTIKDLVLHKDVMDNGERITLSPTILYKEVNGIVEPVADADNPLNRGLGLDSLASDVNRNRYLYTPFHYVLDTTRNVFECRAYLLDHPSITNRTYVLENDTTQIVVATDQFTLTREGGSYHLYLKISFGKTYASLPSDTLFAQLSYVPQKEASPVFLNGELLGDAGSGDLMWHFEIETNLDIDVNDLLYLKNFSMYADQTRDFNCKLEQEFNLIYGVAEYDVYGMVKSDIDTHLGMHLLLESAIGVSHETITLSFGSSMKQLWSNGRTVMGSEQYQVYPEDVIAYYEEDEYVKDPISGKPQFTIDGDGKLVYTIEHHKGDVVLDPITGEPSILHAKGSVVYENGEPVLESPREVERQMDLFFVDGIYYFTTYERDVQYRNTIADTVFGFVNGLSKLTPTLHENTVISFYPKKSLGYGRLVVGNGKVINVDTALSFAFKVYLDAIAYSNLELRDKIKSTISEVVNQALRSTTVSIDAILDRLRDLLKDDVKGIYMDQMTESRDVPLFTAVDSATRCSVKRILKVMPSGLTSAEEDITIDFLRHSLQA